MGSCPSTQLAIVLDGIIQSSPQVQAPSFSGSVSITGSFGEDEARSLARVLNRGAFPVDVEVRRVETVSPTLGEDSLRASVFAGLVGVVLLLGVLFVFYRWLTPLIALGLVVWGMLIYSVAAIISQTTNYALTLAGVTGIVVSIGITVDSYVIYFERLKDEVVHGRTLRNSAARGFKATWRTILAANLVAFIAAAVLFVLSVGSVRGLRPVPRRHDDLRRGGPVLLHPPGRDPAGRDRPPRSPGRVRPRAGQGRPHRSARSRWPLAPS